MACKEKFPMQIFAADPDPAVAASFVRHPKHRWKILLEALQLLWTAHHLHGSELPPLAYKATHPHHPLAKWVAASAGNYDWLLRHAQALHRRYDAYQAERYRADVAAAEGTRRTVKPRTNSAGPHLAWLAAHPIPGPPERTPFVLAIKEAELARVRVADPSRPGGVDLHATYRRYADPDVVEERIRRNALEAAALKARRAEKRASRPLSFANGPRRADGGHACAEAPDGPRTAEARRDAQEAREARVRRHNAPFWANLFSKPAPSTGKYRAYHY